MIPTLKEEIAADKARIAVLSRELGMLRKAHGHLSGIPARHNAIRIAEREDLLATLTYLVELNERPGAYDMEDANLHV